MKLSEMTNKDAFKALGKLLPIIKDIMKDKEIFNIWYRKLELTLGGTELDHRKEKAEYGTLKGLDLATYLVVNHEMNIYKILAVLSDKTPKQVEKQGFPETLVQLTEVLEDEALINLFIMKVK